MELATIPEMVGTGVKKGKFDTLVTTLPTPSPSMGGGVGLGFGGAGVA